MKKLFFYFDYSSPFAYLASTQVERVAAEQNADLVYKPFLLGALFKTIGTPLVPIASFSEPKRAYILQDMKRWATHWDVLFRFPSGFPLRTVDALRLTLLARSHPALIRSIMNATWVEDRLPEVSTLVECCEQAGVDPVLVDQIKSPEAKELLRIATQEAVDRGVPGAPTFVVDDELFWGQDRLLFVEKALADGRKH